MSRLLPLTLVLLFGASGEALADGYVGLGLGSDGSLQGEIANHFTTDEDTSTSRILIGQRFGDLAIEASLFGSQLRGTSAMVGSEDYATISMGVDLKYHVGLIGALEAYGKLGLNKTWLRSPTESALNHKGRGTAFGLGLQYMLKLEIAEIALWADYTRQSTELRDRDSRMDLDGEISMLNLGLSLGF